LPDRTVTHYSLAYVNHALYAGDNGRVLGYDNSHGVSHRHSFGQRTDVKFTSYEAPYERFQEEWTALAMEFVNKGKR
jgi:hypothetical protein